MAVLRAQVDWASLLEAAYGSASTPDEWAARLSAEAQTAFTEASAGVMVIRQDAADAVTPIALGGFAVGAYPLFCAFYKFGTEVIREYMLPPKGVTTHRQAVLRLPTAVRAQVRDFCAPHGVPDFLNVVAQPDTATLATVFVPFTAVRSPSRHELRLLRQLSLHVDAAARIALRPESVCAVMDPSGKLTHRTDDAPESESLTAQTQRIERARLRRNRRSSEAFDAWSAMVDGTVSIVERTDGGRRLYYVLENEPAQRALRALAPLEVEVLRHASRGLPGKLIGYALGLSSPRISMILAQAAAKVGLASRSDLIRVGALLSRDPRAELSDQILTSAEREILPLVVRGLKNREIASLRSRSIRTIANQVASLLRKAKAPNRRALIASYAEA